MNSYTNAFKTRTEFIAKENAFPSKNYVVGLDIGYSGVKAYSHYSISSFPSFVRPVDTNKLMGVPNDTDILYKNEKGETFFVGEGAIKKISIYDTDNDVSVSCSRNRYYSPEFLILARVGIALSIKRNKFGGLNNGQKLYIETGLPPKYLKDDAPILIKILSGQHNFSLRVGNENWKNYSFSLDANTIDVTEQPVASVFCAAKTNDGRTVSDYIACRTLVLDGGFGTLDTFLVDNKETRSTNTFTNLGMKAILQECSDLIYEKIGRTIPVHTIHNILAKGETSFYDRMLRQSKKINIEPLLRKSCQDVCNKALEKIESSVDDLDSIDNLIITGGTGDAWTPYIKERYGDNPNLNLVYANQNEPISQVYSNARGYFMIRACRLKLRGE